MQIDVKLVIKGKFRFFVVVFVVSTSERKSSWPFSRKFFFHITRKVPAFEAMEKLSSKENTIIADF